jgi:MFS family permease
MKIDLVGAKQRGLAMGLNEFAGYVAVAGSALATGWIAAHYGLRPEPFDVGIGFVVMGLALSAVLVRETHHHVAHESTLLGGVPAEGVPSIIADAFGLQDARWFVAALTFVSGAVSARRMMETLPVQTRTLAIHSHTPTGHSSQLVGARRPA